MSPSFGSMCLLVFMGAVLASGSPVRPKDLAEAFKYLENVLELYDSDISNKPLFTSVIESINTSCQRKVDFQLMNVTLNIYLRIFSSILDRSSTLLNKASEPERQKMVDNIRTLKDIMEETKRRLIHHLNQQNHKKEDVLQKLHAIQVDNPEVQRRALSQFIEIQRAAYVTAEKCGSAHSPSAQ